MGKNVSTEYLVVFIKLNAVAFLPLWESPPLPPMGMRIFPVILLAPDP